MILHYKDPSFYQRLYASNINKHYQLEAHPLNMELDHLERIGVSDSAIHCKLANKLITGYSIENVYADHYQGDTNDHKLKFIKLSILDQNSLDWFWGFNIDTSTKTLILL